MISHVSSTDSSFTESNTGLLHLGEVLELKNPSLVVWYVSNLSRYGSLLEASFIIYDIIKDFLLNMPLQFSYKIINQKGE
jgi:hypothetical protein